MRTFLLGAFALAASLAACSNRESTGTITAAVSDMPDASTRGAPGAGPGDAGSSATPPPVHCCQLVVPPDASADKCATGTFASAPPIEPCWSQNAAGYYGRWTCANGTWCSDHGRNCDIGQACQLEDLGCGGQVVACDYPWDF